MRIRSRHLPVVMMVLGVAASCAKRTDEKPPTQPRAEATVTLGSEFSLGIGREASLPSGDLRVRFDAVAEDSRCPTGVQCVWAGNVRVVLHLDGTSGARADTIGLNVEPKSTHYGAYLIRLTRVEPVPAKDARPAPASYVATLTITR